MSRISLGIDLGTSNCVVSILDKETGRIEVIRQENFKFLLPSVFAVHKTQSNEKGRPIIEVGDKALSRIMKSDANNDWRVIGWMSGSVKRLMGNDGVLVKVGKHKFNATLISSYYLSVLKRSAQEYVGDEDITEVTITVPSIFNNKARKSTMKAGKIAGFKNVHIIDEPVSAALSFVYHNGIKLDDTKRILVYDFGGGTFDIAIAEISNRKKVKIISNKSDLNLGGDNIDSAIFAFLKTKYENWITKNKFVPNGNIESELRKEARKLKEKLSISDEYIVKIGNATETNDIFKTLITIDQFNLLAEYCIKKTIEMVKEAIIEASKKSNINSIDDIDNIVLVGGSSRIRMVKKELENLLPGKIIDLDSELDLSVSKGATLKSAIMSNSIKDIELDDSTSLDILVKLKDNQPHVLVERGTPKPFDGKSESFRTFEKGQKSFDLEIYQGNNHDDITKNELLHKEVVEVSSTNDTYGNVKISISVDEEGIAYVTLTDENTGETVTNKIKDVV